MQRAGQGVGEGGFADAWNIFNQEVATGDKRNYPKPDGFLLSLNYSLDCLLQTLDLFDRIRSH
jgi:hypothetical protein